FQSVSLFDILKLRKINEPTCKVQITGPFNPKISDNLIVKTYDLMKSNFNLKLGIDVELEKNIPIAAGLGGGSSDGAATIIALNRLFNLELDKSAMIQIALKLGSDIPFFFSKGQAMVTGKGEIVRESQFPIDYTIVLVSPPLSLSTKEGYADLKMGLTCHNTPYNLKDIRNLEDFFKSLAEAENDFEKVQFKKNPKLGEIKEELVNCGAEFARMSGSGPTIFGVFKRAIDTERACANNFAGCQLFTVEPFCLP
ncbi:MAG: 4-(cytidine 5'-diphospho)-2-C-methyl-D-erythritol kinase, partial [Candidatus Zixiibacteriota bacterium]